MNARRALTAMALSLTLSVVPPGAATSTEAANAAAIPLWDGETQDPSGPLLNRFGGNPVLGLRTQVWHTTDEVHSGHGAFRIDLGGTIPAGGFDFVGLALAGFGPSPAYVDTRDLSRFSQVVLWLRNETGAAFTLVVEVKDHRDSNDHRARRATLVPAGATWRQIRLPLDLADGWTVIGQPDLSRAKLLALVIEADQGAPVSGSLTVDDLYIVEPGGPVDPASAPVNELLERWARRQFDGLWGVRDRRTGLLPAISSFADICATNVLAALIQLLPGAVERGWVSRREADTQVARAVSTLEEVLDDARYLPPRYLDRVTLRPTLVAEESSVDAALLFLALYQYRAQVPVGDPLGPAIDHLLDRFNFQAFSAPNGWLLAYDSDSQAFTQGTYDGYSGEPWLISLAAHLAPRHPVDIRTHYHSAANRTRAFLEDLSRAHLVHSDPRYRAPFLQWLLPLFVNVGDRGPDTYPDPALAANPLANAVLYQREAHARAAALGRPLLLQPDAGDDGSGSHYQQFSYYQDFGHPELFMPWSVAFSFLAETDVAEAALRHHLAMGLHGPLGLTDAARWPTGAAEPELVTARHDFWNLSLSTLALVQHLYGGNERLAAQPAVRQALDLVFHPASACLPDETTLCLGDGRFRVQARWQTPRGLAGSGRARVLTTDSGYFWFFDESSIEAVVKIVDGCGLNAHFWFFAAGLTNVHTTLLVEDTRRGVTATYVNPQGVPFRPVQDVRALDTCP